MTEPASVPPTVAMVPLAQLRPSTWNPRTISTERFDNLKRSIQADPEFMTMRPILATASGDIYGGNMRYRACEALGWTEVPAVITDIPDQLARERALRDNGSWGEWQQDQLAEMVYELDQQGTKLDLLGFDDKEIQRLLDSVGAGGAVDAVETQPVFSNEQIIESAVPYFRRVGFPYRKLPIHVCMQEINKLATTEADVLEGTNTGYHVADTYHPHRFHASAEGMKSPFEAFSDDKLIRKAMTLALEFGYSLPAGLWGPICIVSGTQACSNFRPGVALKLYRDYCRPGATVLDTSTGYGGRLVGFMASGIAGRYIGIDPNVLTHDGNKRMADDLGFGDAVELYNLPAEDVSHDLVRDRCDFAFTSPPYFAKEHYSDDDTQSWVRYKTGDQWRDGFLAKMLALQFAALKVGTYALVNIADVDLRGKTYPLVEWTKQLSRDIGFEYVRTDVLALARRFGGGMDEGVASESILVFHKPSQ